MVCNFFRSNVPIRAVTAHQPIIPILKFIFALLNWVVAWCSCSGNALVVINEVTLRRARLVLGWVTVCGQVNHLGM